VQFLGGPGRQLPALQASVVVQRFLSVQLPVRKPRAHCPVAGSHESDVHVLPSLQLTAGWPHSPVAGSQRSCEQRSPSAQFFTDPAQVGGPLGEGTHVSSEVQRLRSSQGLPTEAEVPRHCPVSSQVSEVVQAFPSSQVAPAGWSVPLQPMTNWETCWQTSP